MKMRKKMKKWQKTLISYTSFLLVILIVAVCFVMLAVSPEKKFGIRAGAIEHSKKGTDITEAVLSGNEKATLENENIAFSLTADGNITVINKKTGKVWSSEVSGTSATSFGQGEAEKQSLFTVTYVNDKNAEAQWTSYEQAVKKKQLDIYRISEDTVRLDFILGESTSDQVIPSAFTKERFEEFILPKLDEDDQAFFKRQYTLYEADKLKAEDKPDVLYKKYPALKKTPLYIAGNTEAKVTRQKLTRVFEKIGYTADDYLKDNELTGFGSGEVTFTYKVAIDFSLTDEGLRVTIPKDEIVFYTEHPLLRISLMKFLTSSLTEASVLIPSGSGAVAEFSVGQGQSSFRDLVYGRDLTVDQKNLPATMDKDSGLSFPMYAMRCGADTVTAIIEGGQASAAFNYNTAADGMFCYYDFTVLQSDKAYIDVKNSVIQCGNDIISEDISVLYSFGSAQEEMSDDLVFSDIAVKYREYLEKKNMLPKNNEVSKNPGLLLELLGSITVKKDMLGLFPVNKNLVMTDFAAAQEMVGWFAEKTEAPLSVKLSGWNKGGLYRQSPGKISFLGELGGKAGYEKLCKYLEKKGIGLYLSAEHTSYLAPTLFGGYNNKYSAMFVDGSIAELKTYSAVEGSNFGDATLSIISPAQFLKIAEGYASGGIGALSVEALANSLNSDYNTPYFDRTRTRAEVVSAFEIYRDKGVKLSALDANDYALEFCTRLENVPCVAGKAQVFARSFPLKQMIIHGTTDYTSKADFTATEAELSVLEAIRVGSGLYAVLSFDNSDYVFPSYYSNIYSSDYKSTRSAVSNGANKVVDALSGLGEERIISYEARGDVTKTVYSNGTAIFVNTGSVDAQFDTFEIGAMSYLRIDDNSGTN